MEVNFINHLIKLCKMPISQNSYDHHVSTAGSETHFSFVPVDVNAGKIL